MIPPNTHPTQSPGLSFRPEEIQEKSSVTWREEVLGGMKVIGLDLVDLLAMWEDCPPYRPSPVDGGFVPVISAELIPFFALGNRGKRPQWVTLLPWT